MQKENITANLSEATIEEGLKLQTPLEQRQLPAETDLQNDFKPEAIGQPSSPAQEESCSEDAFRKQKKTLYFWFFGGLFTVPVSVFLAFAFQTILMYFHGVSFEGAHPCWRDGVNAQIGTEMLIAVFAPVIVYFTALQHQINRLLALRFKQSAPVRPLQLALVSLVSIICIPDMRDPEYCNVYHWLDPVFWIWLFTQFNLYWEFGAFLEKQETGRRHAWKVPLLLSLCVNAYIACALLAPSLFGTPMWLWSQAMGIGFLFYHAVKRDTNRKQAPDAAMDEVKISSENITVHYRIFAGIEEWLKQRFKTGKQSRLIKSIQVCFCIPLIYLACAISTPLIERFNSFLPNSAAPVVQAEPEVLAPALLQNLTPQQRKARLERLKNPQPAQVDEQGSGNLFLLKSLLLGLSAAAAAGILFYLSKPTHLSFNKSGIRFLTRHRGLKQAEGKETPWTELTYIDIQRPPGKNSPIYDILSFWSGSKCQLQVPLKCVDTVKNKEAILKAIQTFAPPSLRRDSRVEEALQPPADYSYTELWLQALSAPPQRERLKPLAEGMALQEGRLEVVRTLGIGGQGQAYLARDKDKDENVVLKEMLLPVYVDIGVRKSALEQFENEAKILSRLTHPQIVKMLDYFVEDHRAYLVLEHVQGSNLRQVISNNGPLNEARTRELAMQMSDILDYLHGLQPAVVHRDFTPDNLILQPDGKLKLIDFNVARQTESTAMGSVVGKHAYLPPEQFRGQPVPQSDIYAMGATLFFLLTGQDPEAVSASHPKDLSSEISDKLNCIVERSTAPDLEKRYRDLREVREDLVSG